MSTLVQGVDKALVGGKPEIFAYYGYPWTTG